MRHLILIYQLEKNNEYKIVYPTIQMIIHLYPYHHHHHYYHHK